MRLTAKQKRFIDEYLVDLNATQAAIRAGYSKKTAAFIGAENLKKPQIQAEVQRRMAKRQERTEVTQDRVVEELARLAFANAADFVTVRERKIETADGSVVVDSAVVKYTSELTVDQQAAIAGIKQGANGVELKLCDKLKALELLGRHMGMFTDKLDVQAGGNIRFVWGGDDGDDQDSVSSGTAMAEDDSPGA